MLLKASRQLKSHSHNFGWHSHVYNCLPARYIMDSHYACHRIIFGRFKFYFVISVYMTRLWDVKKSENTNLFVFMRPQRELCIDNETVFYFVTLLFERIIEPFVMQILRKVNDFGQRVCVCVKKKTQTQTR